MVCLQNLSGFNRNVATMLGPNNVRLNLGTSIAMEEDELVIITPIQCAALIVTVLLIALGHPVR